MSTSGEAESQHRPAYRSGAAIVLFLVITAVGLTGDLVTKHAAFQSMLGDATLRARLTEAQATHPQMTAREALGFFRKDVLPGVQFTLSTNKGVAFGMPIPRVVVAGITLAAVGLIGYFFATSPVGAKLVHISLGLILAGTLGNLYDRLFSHVQIDGFEPIQYQVRDFIDCSGLYYPWIFNLADAYLVIGVGILMLQMLKAHRNQASSPAGN